MKIPQLFAHVLVTKSHNTVTISDDEAKIAGLYLRSTEVDPDDDDNFANPHVVCSIMLRVNDIANFHVHVCPSLDTATVTGCVEMGSDSTSDFFFRVIEA